MGDGRAALAAVAERRPDLILSDAMMPELDGFGLLAELRADPSTSQLPVIMLSARAGEEAAVEGLAAGADDYLLKPFSSRELIARVRANLDLAELRQAAARATERHARLLRDLADAAVARQPRRDGVAEVLEVVAERARALVGAERALARARAATASRPGATPAGVHPPRRAHGRRRARARRAAARRRGEHRRRRGRVRPDPARPARRDAAGERPALRARAPRGGDAPAQPAARVAARARPTPSSPRSTCPAPSEASVGGDWYDAIALGDDDGRARHRRRRRARRQGRLRDGPAAQRRARVPARGLRPGADAGARQPAARHARRRLRDARLPVRRHGHAARCATPTPATRRRWSSLPDGATRWLDGGARAADRRGARGRLPRDGGRDPAAGERARALHRRPRRAPRRADRRRASGGSPWRPPTAPATPATLAGRLVAGDARHGAPRRRRRARARPPRGRRRAARAAPARPRPRRSARCASGCAAGSTPRAWTAREAADVLLAVGEAASNAVEHPLEPAPGRDRRQPPARVATAPPDRDPRPRPLGRRAVGAAPRARDADHAARSPASVGDRPLAGGHHRHHPPPEGGPSPHEPPAGVRHRIASRRR